MAEIIVFQSRYNSIYSLMSLTCVRHIKGWLIFQCELKKKRSHHTYIHSHWAGCHHNYVSDQSLFPEIIVSLVEEETRERRGQSARRGEHLWSSTPEMPKLTMHSTHCGGKCGNTGWEVRRRKLRHGEQRDLRGCRGGREEQQHEAWRDTKGDCFDGGRTCRVWKRLNDGTCSLALRSIHILRDTICCSLDHCAFSGCSEDLGSVVEEVLRPVTNAIPQNVPTRPDLKILS